jgi:hypothetical protein
MAMVPQVPMMMPAGPIAAGPPVGQNSNAPQQQIALAQALRAPQTGQDPAAAQNNNPMGKVDFGGVAQMLQPGQPSYFGSSPFSMPGSTGTGAGAGMLTSTGSGTSALGGLGSFGDLSSFM